MNMFRTGRISKIVVFMTLVNFTFISCSNHVQDPYPSDTQFTSDQLFNGIYFAKGLVAELIPEINIVKIEKEGLTPEQYDEIVRFQANILEYMQINHPDFLSKFKLEITSGDHYRIKNIIHEGSLKILDATSVLLLHELINNHNFKETMMSDRVSGVLTEDDFAKLREAVPEQGLNYNKLVEIVGEEKLAQLQQQFTNGIKAGLDPEVTAVLYAGVVAIAAVLVGLVAAVAQAVVYINFVFTSMDPDPRNKNIGSDTNLRNEQIINAIATKLKLS